MLRVPPFPNAMKTAMPTVQTAVQLVGPDRLELNTAKPVPSPGPRQLLCRVEAVGLCFSDLKLLKQFSAHVRKGPVISGLDQQVLREIPSYVPGDAPTVPGHECVLQVVSAGAQVERYRVGERFLMQADWRWIRTATTNGAFGYNFEGGLQQYVLVDERTVEAPDGQSMLIPASDRLSASAVALVEPWACVENAYATPERRTLKPGGRLLVVADGKIAPDRLLPLVERAKPATIAWESPEPAPKGLAPRGTADLFDDIVYLGADPARLESLFPRLDLNGLLLLVTGGARLGREVETPVGRIHYGGIRLAATTGSDPAEALRCIPANGELRPRDVVNVIGAGGPMGVMHVIRNICQGVPGVRVLGGDLDQGRLDKLTRLCAPLAKTGGAPFRPYLSGKEPLGEPVGYAVVMAPVPAIVAACIREAAPGGIINIFAGIPADKTGRMDLDAYAAKGLYLIGTSGSTMDDMRTVLAKVESGRLDTNLSVAAISGLEAAVEGIRAVEKQLIPGKILVYPACEGLPLTTLDKLAQALPSVAAKLDDGRWTMAAEQELLKMKGNNA